jgi:hypothetical protein
MWWQGLRLSAFWKSVRGHLAPDFKEQDVPASLLESFGGDARKRLVSLLRLLLPLSSRSAPGSRAI